MQETRHIVFSRVELIKAVDYFRRRQRLAEIGPRVQQISFHVDERTVTTHIILDDRGQPGRTVVVDSVEMLAALISYCVYTKVPTPQRGRREVAMIDGELALVITNIG